MFDFDTPNLQVRCNMALAQMVLHMDNIGGCFHARFKTKLVLDSLVNTITQQGLHFYYPKLQNRCNMALSCIILRRGHIEPYLKDIISVNEIISVK